MSKEILEGVEKLPSFEGGRYWKERNIPISIKFQNTDNPSAAFTRLFHSNNKNAESTASSLEIRLNHAEAKRILKELTRLNPDLEEGAAVKRVILLLIPKVAAEIEMARIADQWNMPNGMIVDQLEETRRYYEAGALRQWISASEKQIAAPDFLQTPSEYEYLKSRFPRSSYLETRAEALTKAMQEDFQAKYNQGAQENRPVLSAAEICEGGALERMGESFKKLSQTKDLNKSELSSRLEAVKLFLQNTNLEDFCKELKKEHAKAQAVSRGRVSFKAMEDFEKRVQLSKQISEEMPINRAVALNNESFEQLKEAHRDMNLKGYQESVEFIKKHALSINAGNLEALIRERMPQAHWLAAEESIGAPNNNWRKQMTFILAYNQQFGMGLEETIAKAAHKRVEAQLEGVKRCLQNGAMGAQDIEDHLRMAEESARDFHLLKQYALKIVEGHFDLLSLYAGFMNNMNQAIGGMNKILWAAEAKAKALGVDGAPLKTAAGIKMVQIFTSRKDPIPNKTIAYLFRKQLFECAEWVAKNYQVEKETVDFLIEGYRDLANEALSLGQFDDYAAHKKRSEELARLYRRKSNPEAEKKSDENISKILIQRLDDLFAELKHWHKPPVVFEKEFRALEEEAVRNKIPITKEAAEKFAVVYLLTAGEYITARDPQHRFRYMVNAADRMAKAHGLNIEEPKDAVHMLFIKDRLERVESMSKDKRYEPELMEYFYGKDIREIEWWVQELKLDQTEKMTENNRKTMTDYKERIGKIRAKLTK